MKRLIGIITIAIAAINGSRSQIAALKAEIARLQGIIEKEDIDDQEREAKLADLEAADAEAAAKAEDLAALLNDEPSLPSVHPETFDVTAPPTASAADLEFRERQGETSGGAPGPVGVVGEDAPTGPVGDQGANGTEGQPATESKSEEDEIEELVDDNTKEKLLEIADEEGVDVDDPTTKTEIASAIVAARREKANGPQQ